MAVLRFKAWEDVLHRKALHVPAPAVKISDYFGANVFNDQKMRKHLSSAVYKSVKKSIETGARIDAEKHDAFFTPIEGGAAIEEFKGSMLSQQEPDASSFPNGGLRNTFEARGYTAWDPGSPAFIYDKTLVIPTIFLSYTGEALDNKMPLLKALHKIEKAALDVCHYFDKSVTSVNATLGWEQEYFLIDKALFNSRMDIMMTGRALFGSASAKGQQLDDHYFGSIPERATAFMRDFENESLQLGIPVTTRHNEVAPNQFEVAPMFEECNLANDHNLLLMDVLEKVARRHDFRVLLHEKPYSGLNGSGKHNNWSLGTNTGVNLLSPGHNPKTNLQFLTFIVNTIKAIHDYDDVLRASIASAGNDHRLGANEAPPAIISVFMGSQLTAVLNEIEKDVKKGKMSPEEKTALKLDIGKIPEILLDNTDRNRTSPFAFTGNKFEFRAVGSTANCAVPMTTLNSIVAKQLQEFKVNVDARISKGDKKDEAIIKELRSCIVASKKIRFEGNGYGEEWVKEAKKRGLSNLMNTPLALDKLVDKKALKLFTELGIFTKEELEARHEIELEKYVLKLQIEAKVMRDVTVSQIVPAAVAYQTELVENVEGLMNALGASAGKKAADMQISLIKEVSEKLSSLKKLLDKMMTEKEKAHNKKSSREMAIAYCDKVKPIMEQVKEDVDGLEQIVDDELWPLPKMRELLFTK